MSKSKLKPETAFVWPKTEDVKSDDVLNSTEKDKRRFKTRLNLDIRPLSRVRSNSIKSLKSPLLKNVQEEPSTYTASTGEIITLRRSSSTSSTRSFRGEIGFPSNFSGGSSNSSLQTTPDSPAPDIDLIFAQKIEMSLQSPRPMDDVKQLVKKLKFFPDDERKLSTKSFKISESEPSSHKSKTKSPTPTQEEHSEDTREKNLMKNIAWVRKNLIEMREQDQELARQLISLRLEIQRLKLQQAVQNHQIILENVAMETEEEHEMKHSGNCECPDPTWNQGPESPSILKDMGVTRLNLTNRRFTLR